MVFVAGSAMLQETLGHKCAQGQRKRPALFAGRGGVLRTVVFSQCALAANRTLMLPREWDTQCQQSRSAFKAPIRSGPAWHVILRSVR